MTSQPHYRSHGKHFDGNTIYWNLSHLCVCVSLNSWRERICFCFSFIITPVGVVDTFRYWLCGPLLPCLPPASTLQGDVNGDAERPPRTSCVQEHAHSSLGCLPVLRCPPQQAPSYLKSQMSFSQSTADQAPPQRSGWLSGPDLQPIHQGTPRCLPKLKGECEHTLHPHVAIETTPGTAGRMLMPSQWASEAQWRAAVCHGEEEQT